MSKIRSVSIALSLCMAGWLSIGNAAEGDPVAIRFWPSEIVTLESFGGLTIGIGSQKQGLVERRVDQWLRTDTKYDHVLSRVANEPAPTFRPAEPSGQRADDSIRITSHAKVGSNLIIIEVDGVRITIGSTASITSLQETTPETGSLDSLVVLNDLSNPTAPFFDAVARLSPKHLLFRANEDTSDSIAETIRNAEQIQIFEKRSHNTFGFAASNEKGPMTRAIAMGTVPWQPPENLAKLFRAMTDSNQKSQAVFAKLSANQMNFRPSNGTHSPRWNTEHMMGRQLKFFSQIYHAVDPTIPVMDLNPAQMPPDYSASHPDWTGAEEARQMQRVDDFCHRYAYLLDGLGVEQKAPGSRWPSLRALLIQMDRHYTEHTANTVAKFDLEDWPKQ